MQKKLGDFDRVYLINLKKRADRLEKFSRDNQFIINGLTNLEIFEAVDGSNITDENWKLEKGALGCLESHLAVLKDAKANNYSSIVIFEDDFIFDKDFDKELNEGLNELSQHWDMLYLCVSQHISEPIEFSSHLNKVTATLGTVAYILNSKSFDLLIKLLELKVREVDVIYAHMHFLINAYSFKKNICHHIDGFSDIQNKVMEYGKVETETWLIKVFQLIKSKLRGLFH